MVGEMAEMTTLVSETNYKIENKMFKISCYYCSSNSKLNRGFYAVHKTFRSQHNPANVNGLYPTEEAAVDSCCSVIDKFLSDTPKNWESLSDAIADITEVDDICGISISIDPELLQTIVSNFYAAQGGTV